jgi:hypothetical protein
VGIILSNKYVFCNVCSEIFTCFRPAFDKYLIALLQKTFLHFDNTAADMIHLLGHPLSMHM